VAGLLADQGQQQQLQVVGRQFAAAWTAFVETETAAAAAARAVAVATRTAVRTVRRCVLLMLAMLVAMFVAMVFVMMMRVMMVVTWHDFSFYIVRYILRYR
jgi:hypothetical protein